MRTLTLRDVDEELTRLLVRRARKRRRSVEQEALDILEGAVRPRQLEPSERLERAKAIAALTPRAQQTDSVFLLREDRAL